jgi:ABC-type phosphate transport system ATPase subunit
MDVKTFRPEHQVDIAQKVGMVFQRPNHFRKAS